jgi:hypothetical protein
MLVKHRQTKETELIGFTYEIPSHLPGLNARRLQQMIRIGVLRVPEVVDSSDGFQTMPNKRKAEQLLK